MVIQESPHEQMAGASFCLEPAIHRRILTFLNEAVRPEDLVYEKPPPPNPEMQMEDGGGGGPVRTGRTILDPDIARAIVDFRDREFPLGFRNVRELTALEAVSAEHLAILRHFFSNAFYGRWSVFPQSIPRRGPGGYDGVVHAALLHTGEVLFITADETTLLWKPEDVTPGTFEDPYNQPQGIPNASDGYSVLCGGHSFLSDGQLLVVGGGGYGPHLKAKWGYRFDPTSRRWQRTAGSMAHHRWYPTALTLGSHRIGDSHEVLVVCGHGDGDMEIYDEATDTFREVTVGNIKRFPSLYPGLHLLPDGRIFYSRTGWGSAGPGGGPFVGDDQSGYFELTGASTGAWTDIAPTAPTMPDRTKGMSVMFIGHPAGQVRIMVLGGSDASTNNTYEIIDGASLSPTTNWGSSAPFPDGEHRSLASAVLLPDGTVFVCGGIQRTSSPSALFSPRTNSWSPMAALPSVRDYHSVALLLPSGQVAMAGWNNTSIEIFDPPYLFRGPRPVITSAPSSIQYGQAFEIESPDAARITTVALARPMAITHQTDTEQKILELPHVRSGLSTFGTIDTNGSVTDRFGVGDDFHALAFVSDDIGYGQDLFYYLRHDGAGFSTFGTIDTNGSVTDRFGVGNDIHALAYASEDVGYGAGLFYYLSRDATGFCTFGTINTNGLVSDRFGVGYGVDAVTFVPGNVGYGPNLFYYLRKDSAGFCTFGTINTSGSVTDRFGVGTDVNALTFARGNVGYGPNLFYYLRRQGGGLPTFGTIDTNGSVTDRFGVGLNVEALTFAPGNVGYGPRKFYYLRRQITGLTVTASDGGVPHNLVQQGHYMMFAVNDNGVPSVAKWVYLH